MTDFVKFLEQRQILRGAKRLKVVWKAGHTYEFEPEMARLIADRSAVRVKDNGVIGVVEEEIGTNTQSPFPIKYKRRK